MYDQVFFELMQFYTFFKCPIRLEIFKPEQLITLLKANKHFRDKLLPYFFSIGIDRDQVDIQISLGLHPRDILTRNIICDEPELFYDFCWQSLRLKIDIKAEELEQIRFRFVFFEESMDLCDGISWSLRQTLQYCDKERDIDAAYFGRK